MFVVGKALCNFRSMHSRDYVRTRRTPFEDYNFITRDVWEEFIVKQSIEEAKAKGEKFSKLARRNELHHHLGMTRYAAKMEKWRQEEREAAEARQPNPL